MLRIPSTQKTDTLSRDNPPAARCASGDAVVFETMDCYDGAVSRAGARSYDERMANPATGPLFVEGAMPGDALRVEVLSIKTRGWGAMGTYFGEGAFEKYPGEYAIRVFEYPDGFVHIAGHKIPVETMIGVIGVAPAGEAVPTVTPGRTAAIWTARVSSRARRSISRSPAKARCSAWATSTRSWETARCSVTALRRRGR